MLTEALDIWDEAAAAARQFRAGLLSSVLGDVQHHYPEICEPVRPLIGFLDDLPLKSVLRTSRPFFWKSLFRLSNALPEAAARPSVRETVSGVAVMAFDSFFEMLPDGFELTIGFADAESLQLPLLGLDCGVGRHLTLTKVARSAIRWMTERAGPNTFHTGPASKLRICKCASKTLYEEAYLGQIASSLKSSAIASYRRAISEAIALIGTIDFPDKERIAERPPIFVPISTPSGDIQKSFSVRNLTNVVFISPPPDEILGRIRLLKLAEGIVHESAHNELYLRQETVRFHNAGNEATYYSPWRDDPRPVEGLLHGAYVFAKVCRFLDAVLRAGEAGADDDYIADYVERVALQAEMAVAQIPPPCLMPQGAALTEGICAAVEPHTRRAASYVDDADNANHLAAWLSRNGACAHTLVRRPRSPVRLPATSTGGSHGDLCLEAAAIAANSLALLCDELEESGFGGSTIHEILCAAAGLKVSRLSVDDRQRAQLSELLPRHGVSLAFSPTKYLQRRDRGKGGWSSAFEAQVPAASPEGVWKAFLAADGVLLEQSSNADSLEDHAETARLLAIPECCRRFYEAKLAAAHTKQGDFTLLIGRGTMADQPYPLWNNYAAGYFGRSFLSFAPCSFTCSHAASVARHQYEFLRRVKRPFADQLKSWHKRSILYTEYDGVFSFLRPQWDGVTLQYDVVTATTDESALAREIFRSHELIFDTGASTFRVSGPDGEVFRYGNPDHVFLPFATE